MLSVENAVGLPRINISKHDYIANNYYIGMLLSTEESNDFSKPLVFVNLLLILSECFKYETSVLDLILCFYTCDTCTLLDHGLKNLHNTVKHMNLPTVV